MRLEELVNRNYENLTANDREIANVIFRDKEAVRKMNSTRLAEYLHISRTTLVRFLRKLGIRSFAEFRILMGPEERSPGNMVFHMQDIADNYHAMIDELLRHDYRKICSMIREAGTIYLYGSGNEQKAIAEEFKRIFLIFGKCCVDLFDFGEVETARQRFTGSDLFLAISLSGESPEVMKVVRCVQASEIRTVSLTRWANNSLAAMCHENLYVGTKTVYQQTGGTYEMVAAFYILLDILSVRYLETIEKKGGEESDAGGRTSEQPL